MKALFCRLAQRRLSSKIPRVGWLARHVDSCKSCQSYLDGVHTIEHHLSSSPPPRNEEMCRDIMELIRNEGKVDASASQRPVSFHIPPWVLKAGLATLLVVGVTAIALWKPADNGQAERPVENPPAAVKAERQPAKLENPAQALAILMQQQELLRRDARKLGTHLRERVILFKSVN